MELSVKVPTRVTDQSDEYHGVQIADPFRWLESSDSPEIAEWVAQQNSVTEAYLSRSPLRDEFRARLAEMMTITEESLPRRVGGRWLQLRRAPGENQPVFYWGNDPRTIDRPLVDAEAIGAARGQKVVLGPLAVSPDGRLVAFCLASGGGDYLTAHVRDIETGQMLDDELVGLRMGAPVWNADGTGFFYQGVPYDPAQAGEFGSMTGQNLFFHRLGTPQSEDLSALDATPPDRFLIATPSLCRAWLVIHALDSATLQAPEIGLLEIGKTQSPRWFSSGDGAGISFVGIRGRTLYANSASGSPNGRIVKIDLDRPEPEFWETVIPESEDPITTAGAMVLGERIITVHEHFLHQIVKITDLSDGKTETISTPFPGRLVPSLEGPNEHTLQIRETADPNQLTMLWRTSTINSVKLLVDCKTLKARVDGELNLAVDPSRYVTELLWATSPDGTKVPMTVIHRDDVTPNKDRPTLVYGYGHMNVPLGGTGLYRPWWVLWLERGGVLALPHSRGGGERGRAWYEAAFRHKKPRSFEDCIACVEHLIQLGWTRPERLAFNGQSGGGMTAGVVLTKRPDLFAACIPEVGLYDLLRYHHMTYTATTEIGTSEDPDDFAVLSTYSPQQTIRPGTVYPGVLVMAGERDNRVHPGLSYKFAAALQAAQGGPRPVLLRVQMGAGHQTVRVEDQVAERADTLAFLFDQLGIE